MKTLSLLGRVLFAVCFGAIVWCLFCYEGAREAWHKRRLGDRYEGPLAD